MHSYHAIIALILAFISLQPAITHAEGDKQMPFLLFKDFKGDPGSKYVHPMLKKRRMDAVFVSVQEGNLLRVADYSEDLSTIGARYHLWNDTGKDMSGLPAGYLKTDDDRNIIAFGEYSFTPMPAQGMKIGTSEWPNNVTWKHVWKQYYILTVYKNNRVIVEDLTVERDGKDVYSVLGESSDTPPPGSGFTASWLGDEVFITPNGSTEAFHMVLLNHESPLPEDFPKGLVIWIP